MSDEMRRLLNLVEMANDPDTVVSREHDGILFHFCFRNSKEALNKSNHDGLSLSDGIVPFFSPLSKYEIIFENGEERTKLIGPGENGELLVAIYHEIEEEDEDSFDTSTWIRLISVYKVGPAERLRYNSPMMEDMGPPTNTTSQQEQGHMEPHLPYIMRRAHERKARAEARAAAKQQKQNQSSIDSNVDAAATPARNPEAPSQ